MSKIERLTYIFLMLTCVVSLVLLLERRFAHVPHADWKDDTQQLVGKPLMVPGMEEHEGRIQAVLFLSARCSVCLDSLPFYEKITRLRTKYPVTVSVVSRDSADVLGNLLSKSNITPDSIHSINRSIAGFSLTPTLLIVAPDGTVRRTFVGKLSAERQSEVMGILERGNL